MMGLDPLARPERRLTRHFVRGQWSVASWPLAAILAIAPWSGLPVLGQSYSQNETRLKEMTPDQKQEERRFLFYAGNLPEKDRTTIYDWLREFVAAHAEEIRQKAPSFIRQRLDEAPNDAARRDQLFMHWQRTRRDGDMPFPRSEDY